jgi:regulatory protein YycH of two-component signal transduction system YycFG
MKILWTNNVRGGGATLAIEYRRDLLRLDQVVGEESSQALVEGEISIPENKIRHCKNTGYKRRCYRFQP